MTAQTEIPLSAPKAKFTEAMVKTLVHTFYGRVREDAMLGPIFEEKLAGRWEPHLAKLVDFWSSIAMATGRYHGRPMPPHFNLGLEEEHFAAWLSLFEATARDVCPPDAAAFFIDRAHRIADSFQMNLGLGSKALRFPPRV